MRSTTLRVILIFHALVVLMEAVFAGQFLSGVDSPVLFHERTAWVVVGLCVIQIVVILVTRGPFWLVISSIFILLAEALQTGTGYGRFLGVHIPLGVLIFGGVTWQAVQVFRK